MHSTCTGSGHQHHLHSLHHLLQWLRSSASSTLAAHHPTSLHHLLHKLRSLASSMLTASSAWPQHWCGRMSASGTSTSWSVSPGLLKVKRTKQVCLGNMQQCCAVAVQCLEDHMVCLGNMQQCCAVAVQCLEDHTWFAWATCNNAALWMCSAWRTTLGLPGQHATMLRCGCAVPGGPHLVCLGNWPWRCAVAS